MTGLVRPVGTVTIEKTEMVSKDVLMARVKGAVNGDIAMVRRAPNKYTAIPPTGVKDARDIPADSLTDGLHQVVFEMGENIEKARKKELRKKNRGGQKR